MIESVHMNFLPLHNIHIMHMYTSMNMSVVLCSLGHFVSVNCVIPSIKEIIMNVFCCLCRSPAVLSAVDPCLFCPGLYFCPSTSWNSEQRRTHAAGDHLTHSVDLSASYRDLHYDDSPGQVHTCYSIVKDVRLLILSSLSSTQQKGMLFCETCYHLLPKILNSVENHITFPLMDSSWTYVLLLFSFCPSDQLLLWFRCFSVTFSDLIMPG